MMTPPHPRHIGRALVVACVLHAGAAEAHVAAPMPGEGEVAVAGLIVEARVFSAIRAASESSGVAFPYLLAKAYRESGFDSLADASSSSAAGIFQFTRQTWLDLFRRHGADYGQAALAQRIVKVRGQLSVPEGPDGRRILNLRRDPLLASHLAAEYTRENRAVLTRALGRTVTPEELYIAHFLGPQGALLLVRAARGTPDAPAASLFPEAASSNPTLFYPQPLREAITVGELHRGLVVAFRREMLRFAVQTAERPQPRLAQAPMPTRKPRLAPSPETLRAALAAAILPGGGFALPWIDARLEAPEPVRAMLGYGARAALLREALSAAEGAPTDYGTVVAIMPAGWNDLPAVASPVASVPAPLARAAFLSVETAYACVGADVASGLLPQWVSPRYAAAMPVAPEEPDAPRGVRVASGEIPGATGEAAVVTLRGPSAGGALPGREAAVPEFAEVAVPGLGGKVAGGAMPGYDDPSAAPEIADATAPKHRPGV
jgi:hypothetical protein